MVKQKKNPPLPRDVYICKAVETVWPSGEWVGGVTERELSPVGAEGSLPSRLAGSGSRSVTLIGGTKYDQADIYDCVRDSQAEELIVGDGMGAEKWIAKAFDGVTVIAPDKDRYGKLARKVNVEQVLSYAPTSPVILVGEGERVKTARSWLARANWGREVVELP